MDSDDSCDEMTPILPELVVKRPIYQQDELNRISQYASPDISFKNSLSGRFGDFQPQGCLRKTLPVMDWLFHYKWKRDFFGDAVAGVTVAIMHIPQGMAYAILGNVPPIVGIYMAFFPVLIYVLFGTSRHNSMGTFAVTCMMTGKVVLTQTETKPPDLTNSALSLNATEPFNSQYTATEIATAVSFVVAAYQLIMYCLRLGVMSSLLSETLVSGFTTGAAVHVLTSQIKDLFGFPLVKRRGLFKVILTYVDVVYSIDRVNIAAMIISSATIVLIIFNNELIKPRVSKVSALPVPIEMIVVVLGTTISSLLNLNSVYDIETIGYIPVGLPEPKVPPFALIPTVMMDGFVITMVSYTISMSMALIFAQKMNYEVDANQELMAQGAGNLVGSFFSCMPFCASLSRSLIQQTVGGRTQLASLISCGILLFVLLWIGPFFEPLPRCVLASIIVIALKGMLFQVKDFMKFWRLSWSDAAVWMATFLGVVVLDIEYGLLIGVLFCLVNLLVLSVRPYSCRLGLLPGTELYLDVKRYKGTVDLPGIKLFHYCGGLNFASKQHFRNAIYKVTEIIPQKEIARRTKLPASEEESDNEKKIKVLILDFSALMHVDPAGVTALRNIIKEYQRIDVSIYLTGCSGPVYETIRKCNAIENGGEDFAIFPTVNDAVNFAKYKHRVLQIWTSCQPFTDENYNSGL